MTVRELVALLAATPQDAQVLVSCPFDGGHSRASGCADTLETKAAGKYVEIGATVEASYELWLEVEDDQP